MSKYRTQADGSIVCKHRDISCCPDCLRADVRLVDVYGHAYLISDPAERAEFVASFGGAEALAGR